MTNVSLVFSSLLQIITSNNVSYHFWLLYSSNVSSILCSSILIWMSCLVNCLYFPGRGMGLTRSTLCSRALSYASRHIGPFLGHGYDPPCLRGLAQIKVGVSRLHPYTLGFARSWGCTNYTKLCLISLISEVCIWVVLETHGGIKYVSYMRRST